MVDPTTMGYYLNSVDLKFDSNKEIIAQPENRRIYNHTWIKTFKSKSFSYFIYFDVRLPHSIFISYAPFKV